MGYKDVEISIGDVYEDDPPEWKPYNDPKRFYIIHDPEGGLSERSLLVINEQGKRVPSKISSEKHREMQQKINNGELERVDEDHELCWDYKPPWLDEETV